MDWLKQFCSSCFIYIIVFFGFSSYSWSQNLIKYKQVNVRVGGLLLKKVALADTPEKRQMGLMYRKEWGDINGMLFVFELTPKKRAFWMKNTYLNLSIGFFNKAGLLKEVFDLKRVRSSAQIKYDRVESGDYAVYALETPKGWFKKNKIKKDSLLEILD